MRTPRFRAASLAAPAMALLLAACGGESATETTASDSGAPSEEAGVEETAAANQALLQPSDDARDVQVLSVADGSITSLREAVEGDRPLLLWFWSPH